ncbi:MAG: hypothetical protein KY455_09185 [Euryarchaeota archaeon]|nr:hypothetical protein [Euryarchaeota archaeon]
MTGTADAGSTAESRSVERDEVIGRAAEHEAGRGTYVEGDDIRALHDGDLTVDAGRLVVIRPRRPLPRARQTRGQKKDEEAPPGPKTQRGGPLGGRHGGAKHGKAAGKVRKGRGDQGTWA